MKNVYFLLLLLLVILAGPLHGIQHIRIPAQTGVFFDPDTINPASLPPYGSIVEIEGEKYLKADLQGWGTNFYFAPFVVANNVTQLKCRVKYEVNASDYPLESINTFIKLAAPDWTEITATGSPATTEFTERFFNVIAGQTLGIFQVAGQETSTWSAVSNDFVYISKMETVETPVVSFTFGSPGGEDILEINTTESWTLSSDQEWLSLEYTSGTGFKWVKLLASPYLLPQPRVATLTLHADGFDDQYITVTQYGSYMATAGSLANILGNNLPSMTHLTLTGNIDARDFKTMRDEMPLLQYIDLTAVNILEYQGIEGTANPFWNNYYYSANRIPDYAFYNTVIDMGKSSLKTVYLPWSITEIGYSAFARCNNVEQIIPQSDLLKIDEHAFSYCQRLDNYFISRSVNFIGEYAFRFSNTYIVVDVDNSFYSSENGVLFNKAKTKLIQATIRLGGHYDVPPTVNEIGNSAFENCFNISELVLPASLNKIGSFGLAVGQSLNSITVNHPVPVPLEQSNNVFANVNKAEATIFVPYGSGNAYRNAYQWNEFASIVEMGGLFPNATQLGFGPDAATKKLFLATGESWTAVSSEPWLIVGPAAGTGSDSLSITVTANPTNQPRSAVVVLSAPGYEDKYISVDQYGIVEVTAGNLAAVLGEARFTTTSLTLTGTIDARDFRTIRDEMPLLAELDLSLVNIVQYQGMDGTNISNEYETYEANEIPRFAFVNYNWEGKESLQKLILPVNTTTINERGLSRLNGLRALTLPNTLVELGFAALEACINLETINLSSNLQFIGQRAFGECYQLRNIMLPASVNHIDAFAFYRSGSVMVHPDNPNYASEQGCLYNKSYTVLYHADNQLQGIVVLNPNVKQIANEAFVYNENITEITLPEGLQSIGWGAFRGCFQLNRIKLPASLEIIESYAFERCYAMQDIQVACTKPVDLSQYNNVFREVNKQLCVLQVPFGAVPAYQNAIQWNEFANIVEMGGLFPSSTQLSFGPNVATKKLFLATGESWTAVSSEPWLSISPAAGTGSDSLSITVTANPTNQPRSAMVTISAQGYDDKIISVSQYGIVEVTAGNLAALMGEARYTTTNLTLTGTIDARDFRTMRDEMAVLESIDLSGVSIVQYEGTGGTNIWDESDIYLANEVPRHAFMNANWEGKSSLKEIILPNEIVKIGELAFSRCNGLKNIQIPASTVEISYSAFESCENLQQVDLPSALNLIRSSAFGNCPSLINVYIPASVTWIESSAFMGSGNVHVDPANPNYASINGDLFSKDFLVLYHVPIYSQGVYQVPLNTRIIETDAFNNCNMLVEIVLPEGLQSIKWGAIRSCWQLQTLTIPASVVTIQGNAFANNPNLYSITAMRPVPVDLTNVYDVFWNVNKTSCILNVPYGSAVAYQNALQWQDFQNIVEAQNGFSVGVESLKFNNNANDSTIQIQANVSWTVTSDQPWLMVSPESGMNDGSFTISTTQNFGTKRTGTITISSNGLSSQYIQVSQSNTLILSPFMDESAPFVDYSPVEVISNDAWEYFRFIPAQSGVYTFTSSSSSDPYGQVKNELGSVLAQGDDNIGMNFNFNCILNAGQTYYFSVYNFSGNGLEVTININGGDFQQQSILNPEVLSFGIHGGERQVSIRVIEPNVEWNILNTNDWITVSPMSGTGQAVLNVTVADNSNGENRMAELTLTLNGYDNQLLKINQFSSLEVTPGGLHDLLGNDLATITSLSLVGTIDARDFKTMRDEMPLLAEVDLGNVSIVAYQGTGGTDPWNNRYYEANSIPPYAFWHPQTGQGKTGLQTFIFPNNTLRVEEYAFRACSGLTSLNFPGGIQYIGYGSFEGCSNFENIFLPANISSISSLSFAGCKGPFEVDPGSPYFSSLDGILFNKNQNTIIQVPVSKTGEYIIPSTVYLISDGTFKDCVNLTSVTVSEHITSISSQAFMGCTGLTEVLLPQQIDNIWYSAFEGCSNLASIELPASLQQIASQAFFNCTSLTEITSYREDPPATMYYVFDGVDKVNCTLQVPFGHAWEYREAAGWNEFQNIVELPGYILAANYVDAGPAVSNPGIMLWTNVEPSISTNAPWVMAETIYQGGEAWLLQFSFEENLSPDVRYATATLNLMGIGTVEIAITQFNETVLVAGELQNTLGASLQDIRVLSINGTIDARDFKTMRDLMPNLTEVDLSGVTVVAYTGPDGPLGDGALFEYPANQVPSRAFTTLESVGKASLRKVILPEGLEAIGSYAFLYGGLEQVNIPSTVTTIGRSAFNGNANLWSLQFDVPSSLETIGYLSFRSCTALQKVVVPASVKLIDAGAFSYCNNLNDLQFESGSQLSVIGNQAFVRIGINVLSLPASVQKIGDWAFNNCNLLQTVIYPNESALDTIGLYAFSFCQNLFTNDVVPGVRFIGDNAFLGTGAPAIVHPDNAYYTSLDGVLYDKAMTRLMYVPNIVEGVFNIPEMVQTIGVDAFFGCTGLTTIQVPPSVTTFEDWAFEQCTGLTNFTIPATVTNIGHYAFYDCINLQSIYSEAFVPVDLTGREQVFYGVDKATCTLYVPAGARNNYLNSYLWNEFHHIVEGEGMWLSETEISLPTAAGSKVATTLHSNVAWTVETDQPWVSVSPTSGFGDAPLTVTYGQNTVGSRTANIIVRANGLPDHYAHLTQQFVLDVDDLVIPRTLQAPLVDGIIDGNDPWDGNWIGINKPADFTSTSAMSASFQIMAGEDAFYVAIQVLDATPNNDPNNIPNSYERDASDMCFSLDTSAYDNLGAYKTGTWQIRTQRSHPNGLLVDGNSHANTWSVQSLLNHEAFQVAVNSTPTEYIQELVLPFEALQGDMNPVWDEQYIRFDLAVADNTTGMNGGRTQYNFWADNSDQQWHDTRHMTLVRLAPMPAPVANVTFRVDMSNETVSPNGVHLNGSFFNWENAVEMTHEGNNIYAVTLQLPTNQYYTYKFINGGTQEWEYYEIPPEKCTVSEANDRELWVNENDIALDVVCFASCYHCGKADQEHVEILKTPVVPIVDGEVDFIWGKVPEVPIARDFYNENPTVTASWKAMYDENNMYLLLNVQDDDHYPAWEAQSGNFWEYDHPEIFLDVNNYLPDGKGPNVGSGHHVIGNPIMEGGYGIVQKIYWNDSISWCYRLNGENLMVEYAIPFASLLQADGTPLNVNMVRDMRALGFDITIDDRDVNKDRRDRKVWQNIGEYYEAYMNMDDCGTIGLSEQMLQVDSVTVTFFVDMQNEAIDPEGVFVGGNWNSWMSWVDPVRMEPVADQPNLYTAVIKVAEHSKFYYKFKNGPVYESITGVCTNDVTDDRFLDVLNDDVVLPIVCFNSCESCTPNSTMVDVTFRVDMRYETITSAGVYINGSWDNWQTAYPMFPSNGFYTATISLPKNANIEYKFINGGIYDWDKYELIAGDCAYGDAGNRYLKVPETNLTLDFVCFAECVACDPDGKVNLEAGLVAYYPFDGNANDVSGNNHHGQVSGASLVSDRAGNPDQAYYFDGDDFIRVAHHEQLNLTSGFSLCVWVKPDDVGGYQGFIGKSFSGMNSDGFFFKNWNGSDKVSLELFPNYQHPGILSNQSLQQNTWMPAVVTYDLHKLALYLNGVLDTAVYLDIVPTTNAMALYIGALNEIYGEYFIGTMDEVRIYDRALNLNEVEELANLVTVPAQMPIANAGDNFGELENTLVTLDATNSADPNNLALTYTWTSYDGIVLSDPADPRPSFVTPDVSVPTIYRFSLVVSNGTQVSTPDELLITVMPVFDNIAPVLVSTQPVDDALVPIDVNQLVLNFSEPVIGGTGNIYLRNETGQLMASFNGDDVVINGNSVTIPISLLQAATGYYVLVDAGAITDLSGNGFAGISDQTLFNFMTNSDPLTPHFTTVWTGNGTDHMNFYIYDVKIDGIDVETGDEVAIYDGDLCVGTGMVVSAISTDNTLDLAASANDGSGNGYTSGHGITYKLYDRSEGKEYNATATYNTDQPNYNTSGLFEIGGTAVVSLSATSSISQTIAFIPGWNIFSSQVLMDNHDMKVVLQGLIDDGKLKKVLDEKGKSLEYLFGNWKNNIGELLVSDGYKINVTAECNLLLEGAPVDMPLNIPLTAGWNIISFPASGPQDGKAVLQALIDDGKLKKVLDESGKSIEYLFGSWKNNIGNFVPGKGYKVNVTLDCELLINNIESKSVFVVPELLASTYFEPVYEGNGTDHMNINLLELHQSGLMAGDEIGIFDGDLCVGAATIGAGQMELDYISIPASRNDGLTLRSNGYRDGNPVSLRIYRNGEESPLNFSLMSGTNCFVPGESMNIRSNPVVTPWSMLEDHSMNVTCYPVPFNDWMNIEIQVNQPEKIKIEVFDMIGKKQNELYHGEVLDKLIIRWDGTNAHGRRLLYGNYFIKVNNQLIKVTSVNQ